MRPVRAVGLLLAPSALMVLLTCAAHRPPVAVALVQEQPDKKGASDNKGAPDKKAEKPDAGLADLGDLNAEVVVLQVLDALDATDEQLARLARLAPTTMQKPPPRKFVKASEKFRKTLRALRDALLKKDDEKIDAALATLDELGKKEMLDFDDVEITDEARKNAPAL